MTVEMQREHQQRPAQPAQPAQHHAAPRVDLARTDANRVATLVQIARDGHNEARDAGEDAERLRNASFVLYDRIASKPGDRRTRLDRALHRVDGALDEEAVLEYLDLTGREGLTARQALQQILDRRTLPEFDGGQEISDRLHSLAYAWEREAAPRPALPVAGSLPSSNGARLPQRATGSPSQQVAPPESAAQSTGQIALHAVEAMLAEGHEMPTSQAALVKANLNGASPGAFGAASIPGPRSGDTIAMHADEVLAALAADDASREMVADGPVRGGNDDRVAPRPFPGAGTADPGEASSPSEARSGAGDDES